MREITLNTARGPMVGLRAGNPDGPRVLALHGWLDNAASFIPLLPHLVEFDLVALDLPGHGASAHRLPGYDYVFVDWIHDVLDVLDALQWPSANLLGHSMGGAIASVAAAGAPERVQKLAVIEALGPLSGVASEAGTRLRQAVTARRALDLSRPARMIPDLETAVAARLAVSAMSADAARLIVERNLRKVDGGYVWRSDPRLTLPTHVRTHEDFVLSWIEAIHVPTLVIAADPSPPYFTPAMRDARMARMHDVYLQVVPGGHHLHMDQPELIGALLQAFLQGSPARQ